MHTWGESCLFSFACAWWRGCGLFSRRLRKRRTPLIVLMEMEEVLDGG